MNLSLFFLLLDVKDSSSNGMSDVFRFFRMMTWTSSRDASGPEGEDLERTKLFKK